MPARHFRDPVLGTRLRVELARLLEHALLSRGDGPRTAMTLGLGEQGWSQLVARLKALGVARTVTVLDPGRSGRPCEGLSLVTLRQPSPATMDGFEEACQSDPAVYAAARITGRHDYQLASFHADAHQAERWRRGLESRADVLMVEHRIVRTITGHGLREVPLAGLKRTGADTLARARNTRTDGQSEGDAHA